MKKVLLLLLAVLIFSGVVASSFFVGDRIAPEISVKQTPELTCDCDLEDLTSFATAKDDSLKSFFIENTNINDIIDSKHITYVAIDEANNITKLKTSIEVAKEYFDYEIVNTRDLKIQKGTEFNVNDFFEVQNKCNIKTSDRLKISDFNTNSIGVYDVEVNSTIHITEPLYVEIEVFDEFSPKISLKKSEIDYYTNTRWSDNDFINIIDTLEDDVDSREYLIEQMKIDWREAMHADINGLVTNPGTFEVTYTVNDSDGNQTKTQVIVKLGELVNNVDESEGV